MRQKAFYRIGMLIILAIAVALTIVFKAKSNAKKKPAEIAMRKDTLTLPVLPSESLVSESTSQPKPTNIFKQKESLESKTIPTETTLAKDELAIVNNEKITQRKFDSIFNSLPAQVKEVFKDDKAGFLEELITRELLLQDAMRKKVNEQKEYKEAVSRNPEQKENIMINLLFKTILSNVTVSESELRAFFNQYQDQLPNKDYETVKEQLRPMALEEKQRLIVEEYLNNLKASAKIVRNEQWIKAQEALIADNPLSKALKTGRPVLADFGRGTCVPCKMMQPILEKLQKDYAGKVEILILDVGEYQALARKYRIMMIPTQIFFDAKGNEVFRHQGFMSEADIIAQLKKMGISDVH
uniref:Thioredoxin domain-containing protein n=1 Tax=candidate division WOR-3 bacterium TaxID=2052148 RepID=A0A7C6A992_UNCW3